MHLSHSSCGRLNSSLRRWKASGVEMHVHPAELHREISWYSYPSIITPYDTE